MPGVLDSVRGLFASKDEDAAAPSNIAIERLIETEAGTDEVGRQVEGLYERALRARAGREAAWFRRLLAYSGEGKLRWDTATKALKPEGRRPTWALEEYWNEIRPTVDHAVAIRTRDEVVYSASASTTEGADIAASDAASKIAEHLHRELRLRRKLVATVRMSDITGTAAWEPEWDSGAGPLAPSGPDGPFAPTGAHRVNILSPFEMLPDPGATGDDDGEYLFTIREVTVAWARDRFPDFKDKIQAEEAEASSPDDGIWFLRQYQELGRRTGYGAGSALAHVTAGESRETVCLKKCYIPASSKLPNGRLIIKVGDAVVWDAESPLYPDDPTAPRGPRRFPVFVFRHRWNGKSFWGESLVEDLIGPQETLNRLVSKGLAIIYSTQRPITVTRPGVKITDEPCPVIYTTGGNTPPDKMLWQANPPQFPAAILEFINLTLQRIASISSIHDASRGESSPGDSGVLIRELQEQDSSRLGPVQKDEKEIAAEAMQYLLLLANRWWTLPRAVKTLGADMETEIQAFAGSDLSDSTDIWVEADTGLPHNRVSSWMMVTQLLQTPFFTLPPQVQQSVARMLRIGGGSNFLADAGVDEKRARRMIQRIKGGQQQQVAFYDNFDVINHVFATWMKGEEFESLVAENPELKAMAEQVLAAAAMAKQGQMPPPGAMPGAPPQPGAGPPPAPTPPTQGAPSG